MEPRLIQWIHVPHGAILWITHSPPRDRVGSETQRYDRFGRASSSASRLQVLPWQPLYHSFTHGWDDKKRIWELWNHEAEPPVWCPIHTTECLHEVTQGNLWGSVPRREKKDNNIVTVATNMDEKYTETSVKRWNRHRRAFDNVQQPQCISWYNEHMGGVDLHDLQVPRYHISIRSKKWWWPIFAWSINSVLVNGQRCYWRDHRPAHLLKDCLTVSSAKVWNKTTEPWKEISTECYRWRSGKIRQSFPLAN